MSAIQKMKKVCIILPEHFSSNMGGAEYQAQLLLEGLCATGKYEIYYLCNRADINYQPTNYTLKTIKKSNSLSVLGSLAFVRNLYVELKKIRPAVVYQNVGGIQTGVAAYYSKKHGAKFIWHIASDDDVETQWKSNVTRNIRLFPDRLFLNYAIRESPVIAAQTKFQADLLRKKFGIYCNSFIPIGHPFPDNKYHKNEKVTILWIANMKPLKRPEVFVRLAERFSDNNNVCFKMIGRPGWGNWFKIIQSEINNLKNIEYLGERPQDEVNAYLSRSHILVNTSRYEGFSNTFVQAWMREIPVVSLSVDPDDILVRENIGFNSGTFSNLTKNIRTLIMDTDLREQMGKRAAFYARENHSVDNMVNCAIKLFD